MTISDTPVRAYDNYVSLLNSPYQRIRLNKGALTTVAGRCMSSWLQTGLPGPGVAPTTAAVTTNATTGSLGQFDSAGTQRILQIATDVAFTTASVGGMVTIIDRLSHQGGLSGTTTGTQAGTNLPTAALTRYTSGVGVGAALEIYSAIGTSATVTTVSYTNQGGAGASSAGTGWFGTAGNSAASRFVMVPLASGDTGVQAVSDVNLTVSSGTTGNFGVTLYYPLVSIPLDHLLSLRYEAEALYGFGSWFPKVQNGACLHFLYHTVSTSTGIIQGEVRMCEDI